WTKLATGYYLRGEWQAALKVLRSTVQSASETNGYDYFILTHVLAQLGRHAEAQRSFDQATAWLDANPADDVLLDLAIATASERIEKEPKNAEMYLRRARWYALRGEQLAALADFDRTLDLDPSMAHSPASAQLFFVRGDATAGRGEWQKASADFARV